MRLMELKPNGKLVLTEYSYNAKDVPSYAILSHTWAEDNSAEVSFQDVEAGIGESKAGWKKIAFCADKTAADGLRFFWIDTCCIDKENKAELAQAINSMFHWYRNAARCYVYLSDVSGSTDERNPRAWESDFRKSRWFTRGWTLQELLAPASVEFFSQERKKLGDKSSLKHQIHEITNIPHSALQGELLSQFTVEERLRWIEHRETKLEEDKAYSLLGIFGVYILPIYGEGIATSFNRLQEEIQKREKCMQDLRLTDPRDDKKRIEDTKGGLLEGSYRWILENSDFQQWRRA